jgi:DNA polymerase III subunit gamma/tau
MAYLVLARKYRPQTFEDVVKQDHVTVTLKNAIESNRLAHAVLFSGPRGTGKTTVARILAKAMNCENGPAPVPCNSCKSCHDITSSGAVDVYEIDGASNNGVEQVRELRDNIKYMPAHSRYKIYIIDEVHMLSTAAFNALLKTLEEPPAHVLFIFATTEPHKIPLTILSRCRRHDFRRISIDAITDHLDTICKKENFNIEKESLDLMAREAGGCMRDALSLLDQVMTCSQGGLTRDQILDVMGVIDRKLIFDITDGILTANVPEILMVLDEIYDRGKDMKKLYADLLDHFRNLLVVKLAKNIDKLVDVPKHELKMMTDQVSQVTSFHIGQLFDILFRQEPSVRFSAEPKMALEMALIRMCRIKPILSLDEVIAKLDLIKNAVESGASFHLLTQEKSPLKTEEISRQEKCFESEKLSPLKAEVSTKTDLGRENALTQLSSGEISFDWQQPPEVIWEKIVKKVSEKHGILGTMLAKARLLNISEDRMEIESNDNGLQFSRISKNLDKIRKACRVLTGKTPEIILKAKENAPANHQNKIDQESRLKQEALNHPIVGDAIEIFNGQVIDVTILKEDYS